MLIRPQRFAEALSEFFEVIIRRPLIRNFVV